MTLGHSSRPTPGTTKACRNLHQIAESAPGSRAGGRGGSEALTARIRVSRTQCRPTGNQASPHLTSGKADAASEQPSGLKCGRGARDPRLRASAPRAQHQPSATAKGSAGRARLSFSAGLAAGGSTGRRAPRSPRAPTPELSGLRFDPTPSPAIWDGHAPAIGAGRHQRLPNHARPPLLLQRRPAAPHPGIAPRSRRPQGPLRPEKVAHPPAAAAPVPHHVSLPRPPGAGPPPPANPGSLPEEPASPRPRRRAVHQSWAFLGIASPRPAVAQPFTARYVLRRGGAEAGEAGLKPGRRGRDGAGLQSGGRDCSRGEGTAAGEAGLQSTCPGGDLPLPTGASTMRFERWSLVQGGLKLGRPHPPNPQALGEEKKQKPRHPADSLIPAAQFLRDVRSVQRFHALPLVSPVLRQYHD